MGEPGPSGSGNMFQFPSSVLEDPEHFALFQQQLQEAFKQKQMELVSSYEQAQQALNLQQLQQYYQNITGNQGPPLVTMDSRDSDNNPSSRSSSVSSLLSSSLPQVPTTSQETPTTQSATPTPTHPMKLKAEMRSFSGSGAQTISQHTKDRLKNMIAQRNKEGSQGSLCGTPPHQPMSPQMQVNVSSPHFEPYRIPTSIHQAPQTPQPQPEFHQLRKVNSEPNLKMRIRAKLLSKGSSPVQNTPSFNYSHPPLKRSDSENSTSGNLPVDAILSANTALAQNLMVPSPSLPNLSAPIPNQLQIDIPSLLAAAQLTPFLSLPSLFQAQLGLGSGIEESGIDKNKLDPRFSLGLTQNLPVGGYPSLLKQQLRELVLRRKSLVREEQEDEDSYASSLLNSKSTASNPEPNALPITGLTYDLAMAKHECTCGVSSTHIENGGRVQQIWNRLNDAGLVDKCEKVLAKKASLDQLRLVHTSTYVTFFAVSPTACLKMEASQLPVKSFVQLACGGIGIDTDTYFNDNNTQLAARIATGSLIELACQVVDGRLKNGFACIRPPGHHAEPDHAMGFCFFNNVAICAKQLQLKYPQKCKRIAIIDWDVHHGNGTQQCFEEDPNVLYISLHRHDNGNFYPGTGAVTEMGKGAGKGYTVNVAFSGDVMGDPEYLAAWRAIVEPILDSYRPTFILVSAGFDAASNHPKVLGGYEVSASMFGFMTRQLLNYADGKVVLALEGGYAIESVCDAAEHCVKVLMGEEDDAGKLPFKSLDTAPSVMAQETIQKVISIHKDAWPSLTLQHGVSTSEMEWQLIRHQLQNLSMDTS
ncbi:unnamed protein product [Auanema sp. JU1783]|nr:unnamed protein product [Auanema sp. JU1783]